MKPGTGNEEDHIWPWGARHEHVKKEAQGIPNPWNLREFGRRTKEWEGLDLSLGEESD